MVLAKIESVVWDLVIFGYTKCKKYITYRLNTVLKKETFRPETCNINLSLSMWADFLLDHTLPRKKVGLLTLGENSGPAPGQKVSFFEHCTITLSIKVMK